MPRSYWYLKCVVDFKLLERAVYQKQSTKTSGVVGKKSGVIHGCWRHKEVHNLVCTWKPEQSAQSRRREGHTTCDNRNGKWEPAERVPIICTYRRRERGCGMITKCWLALSSLFDSRRCRSERYGGVCVRWLDATWQPEQIGGFSGWYGFFSLSDEMEGADDNMFRNMIRVDLTGRSGRI